MDNVLGWIFSKLAMNNSFKKMSTEIKALNTERKKLITESPVTLRSAIRVTIIDNRISFIENYLKKNRIGV